MRGCPAVRRDRPREEGTPAGAVRLSGISFSQRQDEPRTVRHKQFYWDEKGTTGEVAPSEIVGSPGTSAPGAFG